MYTHKHISPLTVLSSNSKTSRGGHLMHLQRGNNNILGWRLPPPPTPRPPPPPTTTMAMILPPSKTWKVSCTGISTQGWQLRIRCVVVSSLRCMLLPPRNSFWWSPSPLPPFPCRVRRLLLLSNVVLEVWLLVSMWCIFLELSFFGGFQQGWTFYLFS